MSMTEQRILTVLDKYENAVLSVIDDCGPVRIDHTLETHDKQQTLAHVYWMLLEMRGMLQDTDCDREKIMRWLGFAQGVLWTLEVLTIERMKEDNRY